MKSVRIDTNSPIHCIAAGLLPGAIVGGSAVLMTCHPAILGGITICIIIAIVAISITDDVITGLNSYIEFID